MENVSKMRPRIVINPGAQFYREKQRKIELDKQREWDLYFLGLAKHVSSKSKDPSTKTGAVIVRPDNSLCSTGYNGFARGMEDKKEWWDNREEKYSRVIHCECNALIFAREPITGYTLYTYPFLSCDRCFAILSQAGVSRFVAPKCPDDKKARWEPFFKVVRERALHMKIEISEIVFE